MQKNYWNLEKNANNPLNLCGRKCDGQSKASAQWGQNLFEIALKIMIPKYRIVTSINTHQLGLIL